MPMDIVASNARFYNNLPLIDPKYRSVVHLEDAEDKVFWNTLLQRFRPGKYFFLMYSKSSKGNNTTGCDQCLKYRPYLSSRFFICIDSDLRHLLGEADLDVVHHVIQTYTYSWEDHYCESGALQAAVSAHAVGCGFDFSEFLKKLSQTLYEPLLLLLYCRRADNPYLTEYSFRHILKTQCTAAEAQNNGQGYVDYLTNQFAPLLVGAVALGFDASVEAARYRALGLEADNAYLHVRGHNVYDLVAYIGRLFSKKLQISFEEDVMKKVTIGGVYWEYAAIEQDLKHI